jgi:hypothetical protein
LAPSRDSSTSAARPAESLNETAAGERQAEMPDEAPPPSEDAPRANGELWEGFLHFVRNEAGFDLYVTLSNCEVVRLETERIELRALVDGFRRKLDSTETLSRLKELAGRHFGRDVAVGVAGSSGQEGGLSVHSIEAERRTRLEERALSDPLVQTALDVLGGKVGKISRVDD